MSLHQFRIFFCLNNIFLQPMMSLYSIRSTKSYFISLFIFLPSSFTVPFYSSHFLLFILSHFFHDFSLLFLLLLSLFHFLISFHMHKSIIFEHHILFFSCIFSIFQLCWLLYNFINLIFLNPKSHMLSLLFFDNTF